MFSLSLEELLPPVQNLERGLLTALRCAGPRSLTPEGRRSGMLSPSIQASIRKLLVVLRRREEPASTGGQKAADFCNI